MGVTMRVRYPGLLREKLPSGNFRYRVRVEGNKNRRIVLPVTPDHPEFHEIYLAARSGIVVKPSMTPKERSLRGSVNWLTHSYEEHLSALVEAGQASEATLKQRKYFFSELRKDCGEYDMNIPQSRLIEIRDANAATPGKADNMMGAYRAMFRWAVERGICKTNPAVGIGTIHKGNGGATPWSVSDLKTFRGAYPLGTREHLALTLFMFTACRIGDVIHLGRESEFTRQGMRWIGWEPTKKNSSRVEIPLAPPLEKAIRAQTVVGETYLLTQYGKPFKSTNSFGNKFREWCEGAGLKNRSPHGIRKAAGHLLAQEGATQYQIMTLHGHSQAKTSEVYTKGVERQKMAAEAMSILGGMDW